MCKLGQELLFGKTMSFLRTFLSIRIMAYLVHTFFHFVYYCVSDFDMEKKHALHVPLPFSISPIAIFNLIK